MAAALYNDTSASGGYHAYSALLRSPAFGGRSWLADGSMLTGTYITHQKEYDEIVTRGEPARLLRELAEHEYYRIYGAPGTRDAPEAWRTVYDFDRYVLRYDFGYEGPFLNLGAMSDQFLLGVIADEYLQPDRSEFVFALLVSSHVPFETVPVYRDSWTFPERGREYEQGDLQHFDNDWLTGNELAEGYLAGIAYSLRTSIGYATEKVDSPSIVVILGDHQPRKPVSHSVAGYAVPIHLLVPADYSRDVVRSVTTRWGFSEGLEPPMPVPGEPLWKSEERLPGLDAIPALLEDLVLSHRIPGGQER